MGPRIRGVLRAGLLIVAAVRGCFARKVGVGDAGIRLEYQAMVWALLAQFRLCFVCKELAPIVEAQDGLV